VKNNNNNNRLLTIKHQKNKSKNTQRGSVWLNTGHLFVQWNATVLLGCACSKDRCDTNN